MRLCQRPLARRRQDRGGKLDSSATGRATDGGGRVTGPTARGPPTASDGIGTRLRDMEAGPQEVVALDLWVFDWDGV